MSDPFDYLAAPRMKWAESINDSILRQARDVWGRWHFPFTAAFGRLSKQIDDDAQLLLAAGISIARMELRTYQAEPMRTSLLVDGKVVREYVIKLIGAETPE